MAKQIETMKSAVIKQTFSLRAPGASRAVLVGDFTYWEDQIINLQKQAEGFWEVAVGLEPGEYRYRFLVDGEWHEDPDFVVRVPDPFASPSAVVNVADNVARQ